MVRHKMVEVMTSFEAEYNGEMRPINPCKNLSGHNILDYVIHGGKKVPSYDTGSQEKVKVAFTWVGKRALCGGDLRVDSYGRHMPGLRDKSLHADPQAGRAV